ncbi:putative bifunctional diguanylate cyclase/phosphodiesterase [Trinickia dinghuensis]|uniref:EAL domain-containing protein n=1 Tax=Trinickia dinghuensis TaxID=2291023 RepID=A0A3D8JS83_9BURK|nr:EAL domain-containing protein [Trinickia dinghuensis]RDU95878.1 EAL domain-containing protein [Trinickia dinghuensis]
MRLIRSFERNNAANIALMRSQFEAFSRQLPLLYFTLVANSLAVAFTHAHSAPAFLSKIVPAVLCACCVLRLVIWARRRSLRTTLTDDEIAVRIRNTVVMVVMFGVAFTSWGLSLYRYGDTYAHVHVAFYMSITVIACIFCLMHVRIAALLLTAIVLGPFVVFFSLTGNEVLIAIAINVVLVSGAMIKVLLTYYRDFADLVNAKKVLEDKQQQLLALNSENLRLANMDSLTGLPNRRHFLGRLGKHFAHDGLDERRFAVGIVDLDGFKQVNDLHGHRAGDALLREVGRRLNLFSNDEVQIARLGGDEFGLLFGRVSANDALISTSTAICDALREPYELPQATVRVSATVGIALFPEAGRTAEQLFERADYALYHAKVHRRGQATIFSEQHESTIRHLGRIEQALRQADLEQEMTLHFQPILNVDTGEVVTYESLARWHSPTLGPISPDVFIRTAEKSDLIHQLTAVLLHKALAFMEESDPSIGVSFNLSARDLASPDAVEQIRRIVQQSNVDASRLTFEVTETAVIEDFAKGRAALSQLSALGAKIALDDFGTGYSSLHCIHQLPLNSVKVDRTFVGNIEHDALAQGIVRSIVELCRNLELSCVIEGVETDRQAAVLTELGCNFMQGYHFGRPAAMVGDSPRRMPAATGTTGR